jgi:hypothetical protein
MKYKKFNRKYHDNRHSSRFLTIESRQPIMKLFQKHKTRGEFEDEWVSKAEVWAEKYDYLAPAGMARRQRTGYYPP